jgi:PilZ domain-containing protein
MGSMKQSVRINCDVNCIFNFDGVDYQGVIKNVSVSGVLLKLNNEIQNSILPGSKCGLMLGSNPDSSHIKYNCKVIRLDAELIGVQLLGLNQN